MGPKETYKRKAVAITLQSARDNAIREAFYFIDPQALCAERQALGLNTRSEEKVEEVHKQTLNPEVAGQEAGSPKCAKQAPAQEEETKQPQKRK